MAIERMLFIADLKAVAEWLTIGIEFIAIVILVLGILRSLWLFGLAEYLRLRKKEDEFQRLAAETRRLLGNYLLFGLELLIAADVIHTVISRTNEDLIFLAALVVIRTVISYFLSRELELLDKKKM